MCGIAGILDRQRPIASETIHALTDALAHRGPDGRGIHIDGEIALGHRRLAILDLSDDGRNPMPYGGVDGQRYWITYNGEVYNFLEIRQDLQALGHCFRSQTDTEVVLAAYAQWGSDCLYRFNGMWAFAIWDSVERSLFLARDRFGIKPLFYTVLGSRLAFASEIKAFLQLDDLPRSLEEEIVPSLLQNPRASEGTTPKTLMKNVLRLMPGYWLKVSGNSQIQISRWWETRDRVPSDIPAQYEKQVEEFRELFLDAVRLRMRSDVPLGTCLSGGVDSSAVAASMAWLHRHRAKNLARCTADWQKTFIATFPGTFLDERDYADEVVRYIQATPYYWTFDQQQTLHYLLSSVWSMEEVVSVIATPIWCIYKTLRENGVFVSLDGHGGDELLCGYTWYLDFSIDRLNHYLYRDFHVALLPSILQAYDRCSMAHGIEVRMPFMDWRLVCYAFGLSADSKVGGGFTKRILRDTMVGIMPERNRKRRSKVGFNSPMINWYNGGMADFLCFIVQHPLFVESPFWNGQKLSNFVLAKTKSKSWNIDDWGATLNVWTFINLVLWQLLFIECLSLEEIFIF